MSDAHNHRASHCARGELIEADFDMAFSLIDDPRAEYHEGNRESPTPQLGLSSSLGPAFPAPRSILFPYTIPDQEAACPPAKNLTN